MVICRDSKQAQFAGNLPDLRSVVHGLFHPLSVSRLFVLPVCKIASLTIGRVKVIVQMHKMMILAISNTFFKCL